MRLSTSLGRASMYIFAQASSILRDVRMKPHDSLTIGSLIQRVIGSMGQSCSFVVREGEAKFYELCSVL